MIICTFAALQPAASTRSSATKRLREGAELLYLPTYPSDSGQFNTKTTNTTNRQFNLGTLLIFDPPNRIRTLYPSSSPFTPNFIRIGIRPRMRIPTPKFSKLLPKLQLPTINHNGAILSRSSLYSHQLHELFPWLPSIKNQQPELQDPAIAW
jgi:hypothetical protein